MEIPDPFRLHRHIHGQHHHLTEAVVGHRRAYRERGWSVQFVNVWSSGVSVSTYAPSSHVRRVTALRYSCRTV